MNLIDIASWQAGIDLEALFRENPLDGVIIKATQGLTYVNTEYAAWVKWLTEHDKPVGVYHYANGQDADGEARHFFDVVKPVIGKAVPILDYEAEALSKGTGWVQRFVEKFRELSGVTCMIYCSLSVVQEQDWSALADCPLWIAQYADMCTVYGFLEKPWQKGSVSPFPKYRMHQYTGCGRLIGWDGKLDLDLFYGTVEDWAELAGGGKDEPRPEPSPGDKGADPCVVLAVLQNRYGIGAERVGKLREEGYDPDAVQKKINQLYGIAGKLKEDIGNEMDYINSILWIMRS